MVSSIYLFLCCISIEVLGIFRRREVSVRSRCEFGFSFSGYEFLHVSRLDARGAYTIFHIKFDSEVKYNKYLT